MHTGLLSGVLRRGVGTRCLVLTVLMALAASSCSGNNATADPQSADASVLVDARTDAGGDDASSNDEPAVITWACGQAICHTGQICINVVSGLVGGGSSEGCYDIPDACSSPCACVCAARFNGGNCHDDPKHIDCIQG
jgi:hypothetical protein